jgi:FkbM family methyltransferase
LLTAEQLKVALTHSPRAYSLSLRPYATARFLLRRSHDPDYAAFAEFPQATGLFLDVGANAGMSALSFRLYQRRAAILSIEPNPYHEPNLRWAGRLARRHDYRLWAAGAENGTLQLFVPVYRGVPITAEASVVPGFVEQSSSLRKMLGPRMNSGDFEIVERIVPVKRLDDLGLSPAFVKLDVQGYEYQALTGLRETLVRSRPPTLIEAPDDDADALMRDLGYEAFAYDASTQSIVSRDRLRRTNVLYCVP